MSFKISVIIPVYNVENDLNIGSDFNTMLLCGHNGGGKSTYLKSILICLLLAQSYGIAPSVGSCEITAFKKIFSFSDCGNGSSFIGDSLFKYELKRLVQYVDFYKSLKSNEFVFSVFDDPLHGTDSMSAISLLKGFLKYFEISSNKKFIHVFSTHYNDLSGLEYYKKGFKNYHPEVIKGANGEYVYTYKIVRGFSSTNMALKIISSVGFDKKLLSGVKNEYSTL